MAITMTAVTAGYFDGGRNLTRGHQFFSNDVLETILAQTYVDLASQDARITVVEGLVAGQDAKASVDLATAGALGAYTQAGAGVGATLTQNAAAIENIDGVAVVVGDRILVNNVGTATAADRGIYVVTTVGTGVIPQVLTRATDADGATEVTAGLFVWVERGTAYGDTAWHLDTNDPITLDTTALSFSEFSLSAHALGHERGGDLEINGDHLDIDFTPSNYAPDTTPAEAAHVDDLAAHLAGIDNVLAAVNGAGKRPVRLATAGALGAYTQAGAGVGATLTQNAAAIENIDGVAVVLGDRILVKDGAAGADNGIYTVTTVGTGVANQVLTRATDCDQDADVVGGLTVRVSEGTANGNSEFVLTTDDPIVVDTTALTFEQHGVYALVAAITNVDAGDVAAAGTADSYARGDHEHGVATAAPLAASMGAVPAEGVATTLARSDHVHQANTAPADVDKQAAVIGVSSEPALADHKHDVSTAAAVSITGANAEGAATSLARSDHTHKLAHLVTFMAHEGVATGAGAAAAANTINAHRVIDFDDGLGVADEQISFEGIMPEHYSGGDITVTLYWAGAANAGDVKWDVSWERIQLNSLDIDAGDSYAAAQTATDTAPGTVGFVTDQDLTFTQAQADGIAAGEPFRLLVMRDSNDVGDTMVGDASLLAVEIAQ